MLLFIKTCCGLILKTMLTRYVSDESRSQQRFLQEPEAAVVRPGTNISLHCKVANMGELSQCRWQKNRFPVGIFSGKYSIPENSRDTGTMPWV